MRIPGMAAAVLLAACGDAGAPGAALDRAARCANFAGDAFVTRNELAPGARRPGAALLLRFVQFSDDHIIDDDGAAFIGASYLDPLHPAFEAALRLQEEYADEAMNAMIAGVNACHAQWPAEFMIVTGDSADLTTVAETRRFIDNLDGTFDRAGAFETRCLAELPAGTPAPVADQACTRFTGRGLADTQSVEPDLDDPAYQFLPSRTVRQIADVEAAALSGRAEDGSTDPARSTALRSPGLPQSLRCHEHDPGCGNVSLAMPWMVAFGNHDGAVRGTIPLGLGAREFASSIGRRLMQHQHDFIDEFFFTSAVPGPVGHGFGYADPARLADADERNDGWYAFDAGAGALRMIVLNTLVDGVDPRIPTDLLRNPFSLSDGTLEAVQFDWLKTELTAASARRQLVLVFSHHPDVTFAEYGMFANLLPIEVTAADLLAELASWPNVIAWVAGHTHRHRIRAFTVAGGAGSNGAIETLVACKGPGPCNGFWQIETASLIDDPQEQRLLEVFDNGNGTGTIRAPVLTHSYLRSRRLAERDDRCALYLSDPAAVASGITEAGLDALCLQGGTRIGEPADRNVELMFRMPQR